MHVYTYKNVFREKNNTQMVFGQKTHKKNC